MVLVVGQLAHGPTDTPSNNPLTRHHVKRTHPQTHPATIQGFCADTHRLKVEAILGIMAEDRKIERAANAVE